MTCFQEPIQTEATTRPGTTSGMGARAGNLTAGKSGGLLGFGFHFGLGYRLHLNRGGEFAASHPALAATLFQAAAAGFITVAF